jgi:uncharacterized membrane protein YhhN
MLILVLSFITILSALLCIRGKYTNKTLQIYIFKPITTISIIIIAIIAGKNLSGNFKYIVIIALLFALLGDIFLMLRNKFLHGLISFFIAHGLLVIAFFILGNSYNWWLILIFTLAAILIYTYLFQYLGKMKIPVFFYVFIIFTMAWRAWENFYLNSNTATLLIAIGTILFIISDTNIALNRFRKPYKSAEAIILSTYFISIWLFSFSLNFM